MNYINNQNNCYGLVSTLKINENSTYRFIQITCYVKSNRYSRIYVVYKKNSARGHQCLTPWMRYFCVCVRFSNISILFDLFICLFVINKKKQKSLCKTRIIEDNE